MNLPCRNTAPPRNAGEVRIGRGATMRAEGPARGGDGRAKLPLWASTAGTSAPANTAITAVRYISKV